MNESNFNISKLLKNTVISLVVSLVTLFALISLCAVIAVSSNYSDQIIIVCSVVCLSLCSVVGGFSSAKLNGKNGLMCGLLTGVCIFLIVAVLSLFFSNGTWSILTAIKFVSTLVCGTLGGILGVNFKWKRKII